MYFSDPVETEIVNSRLLLVLGSVVNVMKNFDPEWSANIVRQMETDLGVHGNFSSTGSSNIYIEFAIFLLL